MASGTVMVQFADLTGEGATMRFFQATLGGPTSYDALVAALDGVSDSAITGLKLIAQDSTAVGSAADGAYATAEDKLLMIFRGVAGSKYQIEIPAPDEAIFLTDKETVDPSNAAVIAFLASMATNMRDPNGNALTFVSGKRIKTYTKKGI